MQSKLKLSRSSPPSFGCEVQSSYSGLDMKQDVSSIQPPLAAYKPNRTVGSQDEIPFTWRNSNVEMIPIVTWQLDHYLDTSGPEYSWMGRHGAENQA